MLSKNLGESCHFQHRTIQTEQFWPVTECFGLSKNIICVVAISNACLVTVHGHLAGRREEILTSAKENFCLGHFNGAWYPKTNRNKVRISTNVPRNISSSPSLLL